MKKTYYLLAMLPLWLLSCSSGSDDNGPEVLILLTMDRKGL